MSKFFR